MLSDIQFLLTRPMRGATRIRHRRPRRAGFLLTRPMRGATFCLFVANTAYLISTHTPHAGRDRLHCPEGRRKRHFYSHAPCGARHGPTIHSPRNVRFLLTRPMRGATGTGSSQAKGIEISTHTPHAGRDERFLRNLHIHCISTHTPHAGRDNF